MTSVQMPESDSKPVAAGSSFYAAMRILPRAQRDGMYAVYAFCRAVDDIADGTGTKAGRRAALDQWRADIDRLYRHEETDRTAGLLRPVETFGLKRDDFLAVIDGMEMDVERDITAPDWQTLDLYCDRVASAVGRLSVRIFGLDDMNGITLSHHLGRALQLTNILRDVDEDEAMGRLYLPREALAEAGIADQDIAKVLADPALDKACRIVAATARDHFDKAAEVMARCPRNAVRSPRLMGAVYRAILDRLAARGWVAPRDDVRLSKPQLAWAIVRHGLIG